MGAAPGSKASQPRQSGGRFGSTGGVSAKGASNNSATQQVKQDFPSLVKALKKGQSVTLPNSKVKIKHVDDGYQVFDGKQNILVKTYESAISKAQGFAMKHPAMKKGGKRVNADAANAPK